MIKHNQFSSIKKYFPIPGNRGGPVYVAMSQENLNSGFDITLKTSTSYSFINIFHKVKTFISYL